MSDLEQRRSGRRGRHGTFLTTAHLDHDHRAGELRAVLCLSRNSAIGNFGDDPERMRRAASYLEGDVWPPIKFVLEQYPLPS